jgi:putative ABC transport system permease protein
VSERAKIGLHRTPLGAYQATGTTVNTGVTAISLQGLALAFLPVAIVFGIMFRWSAGAKTALYATLRMLLQLLLIGYVLAYIFAADRPAIIIAVLAVMLTAASWIAIRPLQNKQTHLYRNALVAISVAGVPILVLVSQVVIGIEPWFSPRYVVPLAGMIFAGAMNTVSLAAERLQSECDRGTPYIEARRAALQASLIPIINSLFAVGLVSLPGMMTGQILSGISPLIAAKYQIVVMTMLFGVSGISAALYLTLAGQSTREPLDSNLTSQ